MEKEHIVKVITTHHENCCNLTEIILALIKQQDEQIFQLENRLKECENGYSQTLGIERARVKELTEENERLTKANEVYAELEQGCLVTEVKKVQADTVREFSERLKYTLCINNEENTEFFDYSYTLETIDEVANKILNNTED